MAGQSGGLGTALAGTAATRPDGGRTCPGRLERLDDPTGHRAGRAAAARPQHELGRQQLYGGGQVRVGDALNNAGAGLLAQQAHGLVHGGERGIEQAAGIDVVEADHGHLLGDPYAGRGEGPQDPDRHLVVGAHDRFRQRPAESDKQFLARLLAAADTEDPLRRADQLAVRMAAQDVFEGEPPLDRVRRVRGADDVAQAPLAMSGDEVSDDGGRAEKLSAATTSAARSPGVPAMTTTGTRAAMRSM